MFVQAAHTAAPFDMGDANNEQDEDPGNINSEQADESNGTQAEEEKYVKLETYKNNYYTQSSKSKGLFALTKVPATEHRVQEPSNKVQIHNIWIMVAKNAMEQPVLLA
ncbi:hypothetical protein C0989_004132 [Termitomyces sp. Mn162]|nr:hypothetical protein C0989_004132 [Termitomyces sp. Mn162]